MCFVSFNWRRQALISFFPSVVDIAKYNPFIYEFFLISTITLAWGSKVNARNNYCSQIPLLLGVKHVAQFSPTRCKQNLLGRISRKATIFQIKRGSVSRNLRFVISPSLTSCLGLGLNFCRQVNLVTIWIKTTCKAWWCRRSHGAWILDDFLESGGIVQEACCMLPVLYLQTSGYMWKLNLLTNIFYLVTIHPQWNYNKCFPKHRASLTIVFINSGLLILFLPRVTSILPHCLLLQNFLSL